MEGRKKSDKGLCVGPAFKSVTETAVSFLSRTAYLNAPLLSPVKSWCFFFFFLSFSF